MNHLYNVAAPFLLAALLAPSTAAADDPPLPESETLYAQIIARHRPMYDKYQGVELRSRVEAKVIDPDTNEVEETTTLVNVARNYFYRERVNTPIAYSKNGEELDPGDYEHRGSLEPLYPIFDAKGPERYKIEVKDRSAMRRRPCYLLEVTPREASPRHFSGILYVDVETLDLVYMDGTLADLPFGVQSLSLKFYLQQKGDVSVMDHGTSLVRVHVPVVYDAWFVSKITALEAKPIPK